MNANKPTRNKLELEYPMRSSANILFQYISNPSGLQIWFADHVGVQGGDKYKFKWDDGTETNAILTKSVNGKYVRFRLLDAPDVEEFLEFRISQDAITGDIDLVITEYVNEGDEDNTAAIWDAAVENLKYTIGG